MIRVNDYGSFGAKFSVITSKSFDIRITTAKTGLLGGLSTTVWDDSGQTPIPVGEIKYPSTLSKTARHLLHDKITTRLDELGEAGVLLEKAYGIARAELAKRPMKLSREVSGSRQSQSVGSPEIRANPEPLAGGGHPPPVTRKKSSRAQSRTSRGCLTLIGLYMMVGFFAQGLKSCQPAKPRRPNAVRQPVVPDRVVPKSEPSVEPAEVQSLPLEVPTEEPERPLTMIEDRHGRQIHVYLTAVGSKSIQIRVPGQADSQIIRARRLSDATVLRLGMGAEIERRGL